ncbi:MAG: MBL fold metallo-hydrolase [Victivallales bacterium]|nr:MBL fold metallo-hydrolase [Victivallales bacterium]
MNKFFFMIMLGCLSSTLCAAPRQNYTVDECEVVAIQDASHSVSATLFGEDEAVQQALKKLYPRDAAPSSVNVFLIHSGERFILVDTGFGNNRSSLVQALDEMRVVPSQITDILLTHLHGDHIGGMVSPMGQTVFPNATIWLSQEEFRKMKMGSRDAAPLMRSVYLAYQRKMKFFKDGQEILPGIVARLAAGHTPGHATFLLNGKFLFIGDLLHAAVWQFPRPDLCTKWDADPEAAVAVRRAVLQQALSDGLTIAGAHLPFPGVGTVHSGGDRGEFSFHPKR